MYESIIWYVYDDAVVAVWPKNWKSPIFDKVAKTVAEPNLKTPKRLYQSSIGMLRIFRSNYFKRRYDNRHNGNHKNNI